MKSEARVAFVTDALPVIGGAERTLFAALECFPQADIFTLIYNKDAFADTPLGSRAVVASYLNKFPLVRKHHRAFLPLMPGAIEQFDLRGYDVVVSFNYAVANGVRAEGARHLSYTHTPMRYAWGDFNINGKKGSNNFLVERYMQSFRQWDRAAAAHIGAFATISHELAGQIRSVYQREARVIYPPVEVERFHACEKREAYYAVVSRLVAHKRVDLIVEAFSALGLPLKIIGDGPEKAGLMRRAAANIQFLGFQPDACIAETLSRARGFVCAADEDFGIAMVEAQAAGCPVIAYSRGGALETVVGGQTGLLFPEQSSDCIIEAVRSFDVQACGFDAEAISANARRFDKATFKQEFQRFVADNQAT